MAAVKKDTGPGSDDEFVYDSPAGEIRIKAFSRIPKTYPVMEALTDNDNSAFLVLGIRSQATPEMIKRLRKLDAEQFDAFVDAWIKGAGVRPGESPAS